MQTIIDLSLASMFRFVILFLTIMVFQGCAVIHKVDIKPQAFPIQSAESLAQNEFTISKDDDVVGRIAVIRIEKGDTLPDVARHFSLGINEISLANPGVDVWVPEAGTLVMLPFSFILPDAPRKGIIINLATMRLFHFQPDKKSMVVSTYPVGIGTSERPTPMGKAYVMRKVIQPTWHVPASIAEDHRKKGDPLPAEILPGPENPLGEYALYLSKSSYLIHGTNKPASIGLKATNGCIRLYPEHIQNLYRKTPVNTSVYIINQPYLIGKLNGMVYIEIHAPVEAQNTSELKKLFAKLKDIEKKSAYKIDWKKVYKALDEVRGVPVPILDIPQRKEQAESIVEIRHPGKLYGSPEIPELRMEAWYVLVTEFRDAVDAARMAAMINHQGPPIPARVLSKRDSYRVIAGPFKDVGEAKDAMKRLKIDLGMDGILIEPVRN